MHPSLKHLVHRPWPLPPRAWAWRQRWEDLAFIHYRVDAASLAKRLPRGVTLQYFDGSAWVGLVPFRMAGVARRPLPAIAPFSTFPELNLRTYVECEGKPGVWFFSLDAASWPTVFGGRNLYGLPYFSAAMRQKEMSGWQVFTSTRRRSDARFRGRYRPTGTELTAPVGTFEHWATERYCLYSISPWTGLIRIEVHHAPWPLQQAAVEIEENSILAAAGLTPMSKEPVCHFSRGVDVIAYPGDPIPIVA